MSLDTLAGQLPMKAGFPQYSTKWKTLATTPAVSSPHIDAAKFGTWVHIRKGAKLWGVLEGDIPEAPLVDLKAGVHRWKYFVLEEDDRL